MFWEDKIPLLIDHKILHILLVEWTIFIIVWITWGDNTVYVPMKEKALKITILVDVMQ